MPRRFNHREVTRALENKLSIDFGPGSERNGWYSRDGVKIVRITLPHIHSGTIHPKTLGSIRKQTRLTKRQFEDLVDCPMSGEDYENTLRSLGLISSR